MHAANDIATVSASLCDAFGRSGHVEAQRVAANWPEQTSVINLPEPCDLPVTDWLSASVACAPHDMVDVVRQLAKSTGHLRWQQTYTSADLGQRFLDRYGWSLLVGPDAPIESKTMLSGFLFFGPDVEYPVHAHAAEEVYVVLSGTASWCVGETGWEPKPPGCVIHNSPWQPHGMRTDQGHPLLLGFAWKAGAVEKSTFSRSNQSAQAVP